MKHALKNKVIALLALAWVLLTLPSCSDEWDNHYDKSKFDLPDVSLNQYVQSQSNLSLFAQMLNISGYDTIIAASQSYTVWAPTNEALSGIDLNDKDLVLEIVKNHVARSTYSTAGVTNKPVYMLNSKYVAFTKENSGYYFGKVGITTANIPTKNGLVHVINGYAPYVKNIWEYIARTPGLDSLKKYINSKAQKTFDPANSDIISYENGEPVYDSIFVDSNWLFDRIGLLDNEDSTYTAILPKNDAWTEAYNRSKPFFVFRTQDGGAKRQEDYAKQAIVKDLVFSGKFDQPSILDSLVSTSYTVFYKPAYLFDNTEKVELSNGLAYVANNKLNYADTASWYKRFKVEAEYTTGRTPFNCNIYTKSSVGLGYDISNYRYIEAQFISGSQCYVSFTIPANLSAAYNIYCVFAPSNIETATDTKPVKTRFQLQILKTGTTSVLANKSFTSASYITDPTKVTKMFVGTYTFANANIEDEDYGINYATTLFRVYNDGISNSALYNQSMRIDCIILEPVK